MRDTYRATVDPSVPTELAATEAESVPVARVSAFLRNLALTSKHAAALQPDRLHALADRFRLPRLEDATVPALWEHVRDPQMLRARDGKLKPGYQPISTLCVLSDGSLVGGGIFGTIFVWNTDYEQTHTLRGTQRLALRVRAMTGRRFVSADATTLDVWDLDGDTDAPSRTFKKGGVRDVCHV